MREVRNYYTILGLHPRATLVVIKARYRQLSKAHHPDRGGDEAAMAAINEAYATLSDPIKRAGYDALLRRQTPRPQTTPRPHSAPPTHRRPTITVQPLQTAQRVSKFSWWMRLTWSAALVVIAVGLLLFLPIVQADRPESPPAQQTQPLAIDPPADPPQHVFVKSPDIDSSSGTDSSANAPNTTPSSDQTINNSALDKAACSVKKRLHCAFTQHTDCADSAGHCETPTATSTCTSLRCY